MNYSLTNEAECLEAFRTFCRIWGSGRKGSLHLETSDGEVYLRQELCLGSLNGLRPGPIGRGGGNHHHHRDPHHHHQVGSHSKKTLSRKRRDQLRAAKHHQPARISGSLENVV